MRRSILLLLLAGMLIPSILWAASPPRVLVSIKPIHSLTTAIMADVGTPQLLITGGGSPHGYTLRPSEARLIADADLVIWIGQELESFLVRPLENLNRDDVSLSLLTELPQQVLPVRSGGTWEGHGHNLGGELDHHDSHHDQDALGHHDDDAAKDPHIWTSPLVAKEIVILIADRLSAVDPSHADIYTSNATKLTAQLDQLFLELKAQLQPVASVPYVVFHDAYQYFERDFAVNAIGSVAIDAERAPGVRRVMEVRDKISELNARAVFSEPQFQSRIIATIIEGTGVKTGILDPMGAELAEGPDAYFELIRDMGSSLATALQ